MDRLHINSSLPRSGSELLQALLGQHPDVYASATSPLLDYWMGAMSAVGLPEVKSQNPVTMRRAFAAFRQYAAHGYYGEITDRPVVIDKSRGWTEYAELLWEAFPNARMVSMIRPVEQIVASLERLYQMNIGHPQTRALPKSKKGRADHWMASGELPLGVSLERFADRVAKGCDPRILYVQFADLTNDPVGTMRIVFDHLELDRVDVDPDNVKKSADEQDQWHGIFGNHQLKPKVEKGK